MEGGTAVTSGRDEARVWEDRAGGTEDQGRAGEEEELDGPE